MKNIKNTKRPAVINDVRNCLNKRGINILWNEITGKNEIYGMPANYSKENSPNTLPNIIYDEMKLDKSISITRQDIIDALIVIADENRFNPVKIMLGHAPHDGHDRLQDLNLILGIENDAFSIRNLRKWLHQSIAMALNDDNNPYGADGVLVLQGNQGAGKTLLCSKLAMHPDLFAEGVSIDLNKTDTVIQTTGVWIAEMGELDSTLKREQSQLKAFITNRRDVYRVPYAKAAISKTRRTSFCATVNPEKFLNDETGSRRFWVVHVDNINIEMLKKLDYWWFQQLWRQVYEQLYLPNPQGFRFTAEERRELEAKNHFYEKPLPGEIEITDILNFNSETWEWYKISHVINVMDLRGISAAQVGKVLTKLAKRYPEIQVKNVHNVKEYYLPKIGY